MTDPVGVSGETPDELDVLEPSRVRSVTLNGEVVEVRPLDIGRLPGFSRAVRPILKPINDVISAAFSKEDAAVITMDDAIDMVDQHGEALIAVVAVGVDRPIETVSRATIDEFIAAVIAVFAVNVDFFSRRLLPNLGTQVVELAALLRAIGGSGRTRSNSSGITDTH